ncbi:hypothetical protein LTR66_000842 [Elasticomyces elasticus]|nr:hypothetical protein LTR28_000002 [Elasticomyces elasticus]KAK5000271.1 hypothetical protein LTR66_000842 [Elasticomyces elasticus]
MSFFGKPWNWTSTPEIGKQNDKLRNAVVRFPLFGPQSSGICHCLRLFPGANSEASRNPFRKLAVEHRPDRNPSKEAECTPKFQVIQTGYGILGDPVEKGKNDAARAMADVLDGRAASRHSGGLHELIRKLATDTEKHSRQIDTLQKEYTALRRGWRLGHAP